MTHVNSKILAVHVYFNLLEPKGGEIAVTFVEVETKLICMECNAMHPDVSNLSHSNSLIYIDLPYSTCFAT